MPYHFPDQQQLERIADAIASELDVPGYTQNPKALMHTITQFIMAADFTAQKFDTTINSVLDVAFFPYKEDTEWSTAVNEEFIHQLEHLR